MPKNKKYKLFSASGKEDGKSAPCAFFASPEGCKSGDKCRFLHETAASANLDLEPKIDVKKERSSSVISSESEGGAPMSIVPVPIPNSTNHQDVEGDVVGQEEDKNELPKNKTKKKRRGESDIFAKPGRPTKMAKKESSEPSHTNSDQPPEHQNGSPSLPPSQKAKASKKVTDRQKSIVAVTDFRNLNLPVSAFSALATDESKAPPVNQEPPSEKPSNEAQPPEHPLPTSNPSGRKWLDTVVKTRSHPRYKTSYDFHKMKQQDEASGAARASDWIKAKKYGAWCEKNPQVIAIDCEMCETEDPVTGKRNPRALCRISVVNAEKTEEVLLDTLVKPSWPVSDYRTWVNGIEAKHLENVQFTLRHAQAFMMALCSEETVILGHAVHNDLAAIRMEHHCNVDSANLFQVKDEPEATPGLKDVAKSVLKRDMPATHDSTNDARVALECLQHWLDRKGNVEPVDRSRQIKNKMAACQLFVHRIPKICQKDHLVTMFLNHTHIQPTDVNDIEFSGQSGKTLVTFASPRHANLAFATLEGEQEVEASGRLQKKVFLRSGGYIRVRKMLHERGEKKPVSMEKNDD
jgi:RNA exonuclease 1